MKKESFVDDLKKGDGGVVCALLIGATVLLGVAYVAAHIAAAIVFNH